MFPLVYYEVTVDTKTLLKGGLAWNNSSSVYVNLSRSGLKVSHW